MIKYGAVGLSALLLCGCASYRVKPLRKLTKETASYAQQKDGVEVCAERVYPIEFRGYTDGTYFDKKAHIIPVLVTVSNNTDRALTWCRADVLLPLLTINQVVKQLHFVHDSYALKRGAYTAIEVAGTLAILASIALLECCPMLPLEVPYHPFFPRFARIIVYGGVAGFIGGWVYEKIQEAAFKRELRLDLSEKLLAERELIQAGDCLTKLLVTHEAELANPFTLVLHKENSQDVTFVVTV